MAERKSNLFPNKKNRPKSNGMNDMMTFSSELEKQSKKTNISSPTLTNDQPIRVNTEDTNRKISNPNKSHKGKAGRKAEYNDPRLKKDQNMKVSLSTKLRVQRLISRKFDNKSEGDVIDIALNYLVSSFDRDDRDSLYKAYKEDMDASIPIVRKKIEQAKKEGKSVLELTDDVNLETLKQQKDNWVSPKFH